MTYKKPNTFKLISALLLSGFAFSAAPTLAAAPKPIAQHKDWSIFAFTEKSKMTCFAVIQPSESLPKGVRRGGIFFSVTHSQADKSVNAVSIAMGYPLKAGSEPTATIAGKTYTLFAQGETAWPTGNAVEKSLIAAMKRGSKMVIKGISGRGTKTTDTYSLSGVTNAINGAKKHCKL